MVKTTLSFGLGLFLTLLTAFGEAQAALLSVDDFSHGTPVLGVPVTSLQAPSYAGLQSRLSSAGKLSRWELAPAAQVFNFAGADPVGIWLVRKADTVTTPEPSTVLLLGGGLIALAVLRKRKVATVYRIA